MSTQREYQVAIDARSTLHAWITAESEVDAIARAEDLYTNGDGNFEAKGGEVNSIIVLHSRQAMLRRFRIAFEQAPVHSIIVEATDLDAAIERAEQAFLKETGFFPKDPPDGWQRHFNDWSIVNAEEVQS